MVAFTLFRVVSAPWWKVTQVGARAGGKCRVNCLYSIHRFYLPWSNHGCCQVFPICTLVHFTTPISPRDDERTPHAKLYTPRRFHLLRGVRPGVPHPHVRARGPDV